MPSSGSSPRVAFDSKGFADSGRIISPSEFLDRLSSIREDYPDAAYYSLMNLLDSHDTERLLWTLTPGAETTAAKELDAANVAAGKARVRLASLIQFTVPGAPTVYYGDEVGVTGDDDPDDRRTYPWADLGGSPDTAMLAHYTQLAQLRRQLPVLTDGDFKALLADGDVAAYGRRTGTQAAHRRPQPRRGRGETVSIPLGRYLRDGLAFTTRFALGSGGSTGRDLRRRRGRRSPSRRTAPSCSRTSTVDLTAPRAPTLQPRQRGRRHRSPSRGPRSRAPPRTTSGRARSPAAAT